MKTDDVTARRTRRRQKHLERAVACSAIYDVTKQKQSFRLIEMHISAAR